MTDLRSAFPISRARTGASVWAAVIGAVLVVGATVLVLTIGAASGAAAAVLGAGVTVLLVWALMPGRSLATPRWLTLVLLALVFSTLMPSALSTLVQTFAVAVGFILWIASPAAQRRGSPAVLFAAIILVYWAALLLHPNVPEVSVGLLGLRKTAMCVAGYALGAAIAPELRWAVERTVVKVLLAGVAVSIVIHFVAPGVEAAITRGAGEYTAIFGNQARLQGIFAGPFHIAVAGIVLVTWAVVRFSRARLLASLALAVGLAAIAFALVRSAFVATAVALVVAALVAPTVGKATKRLAIVAGLAIAAVAVASIVAPQTLRVLDSIAGFQDDTRFLGRFAGYQEGLDLLARSPLIGWGAGAAGDTLDHAFIDGEHITSHNVVLKIAVEGGLLGLAAWVVFIVLALRATRRGSPERTLAAALLAGLLAMGMTVAATETLPISYLVFVLVGLCAAPRIRATDADTSGHAGAYAGRLSGALAERALERAREPRR